MDPVGYEIQQNPSFMSPTGLQMQQHP